MIIWIVLAALVLIFIVTSFIKIEHDMKAIKATVLIVIIILLAGTIFAWAKSDNNDLNSPKGFFNSIYSYFAWVGDASIAIFEVGKEGITTIGNAIKQNTSSSSVKDGRR